MLLFKKKQKFLTALLCLLIFSGSTLTDCDGDGINNTDDNCEGDFTGQGKNADQANFDNDAFGDVCDVDPDDDGILELDLCPFTEPLVEGVMWKSTAASDRDRDGCRDSDEDTDWDNDGVPNDTDNCKFINNRDQRDTDDDGIGEVCDDDKDNDGITNDVDNCLQVKNSDQLNYDEDALGDACDQDDDNDGVSDLLDLCDKGQKNWTSISPDTDLDGDGCRDSDEDRDDDADTVPDDVDNCPRVPNKSQVDNDGNGKGFECDPGEEATGPTGSDELPSAEDCDYELPDTCDSETPLSVAACYLTKANQESQAACSSCADNQSDCRQKVFEDIFSGCAGGSQMIQLSSIPGCDESANKINQLLNENPTLTLELIEETTRNSLPDPLPICSATDIAYCQASGDDAVCACRLPTGRNLFIESYSETLANVCLSPGGIDDCDCAIQVKSKEDNTYALVCEGKNYLVQTGASVFVAQDDRGFSLAYKMRVVDLQQDDPDATLAKAAFRRDVNNDGIPDVIEVIKKEENKAPKTACTLKSACNYDDEAKVLRPGSCVFPKNWFEDGDGDGLGDPAESQRSCSRPAGYIDNFGDNCPSIADSDTTDTDGDGAGNLCDLDDDNDGTPDADDAFPLDPTKQEPDCSGDHDEDGLCDDDEDSDDDGDGVLDGSDDCPKGDTGWTSSGDTDYDGDGCQDAAEDTDDDNDTIADGSDTNPKNILICTDSDGDGCDDCSGGEGPDSADDGTDTDSDGLCDTGDTDDDGDGVNDGSDDCPTGEMGWTSNGSTDFDGDGCQDDSEDSDDDNDTVADGSDTDPKNATVCQDTDGDTCDDCANENGPDPADDGTDTNGDGECDTGDADDDGDGVVDGSDDCPQGEIGWTSDGVTDFDSDGCQDSSEDNDDDNDGSTDDNDSDDNNANVCSDTDGDTCDDCTNGSYDPANDGLDTDANGTCDAGEPDCAGNPGGGAAVEACGACLETASGTVFSAVDANVIADSGVFEPVDSVGLDLDGDGDLDVVSHNLMNGSLNYYLNDGNALYGGSNLMSGAYSAFSRIVAVDYDNDLDMDVVITDGADDEIIFVENQGGHVYNSITVDIGASCDFPADLVVVDVDEDGDHDFVTICTGFDKLLWYENDGTADLTDNFTAHELKSTPTIAPKAIAAGDIDDQNGIDIVVSYASVYGVRLFTNDGSETFAETVVAPLQNISDLVLFDADSDDDLDLAFVSQTNHNVYFSRFSNPGWEAANSLSADAYSPRAVTATDINNDGFIDIVSSGVERVRWFEHNGNNSSPDFDGGTTIFNDAGDSTLGMLSINAYDIDRDGDNDLLTTMFHEEKLFWLENDQVECYADCDQLNTYYGDADGDGDGYHDHFIHECLDDADPAPSGYSKNNTDTDPLCGGAVDCNGVCAGPAEASDDSCGICWTYDTNNLETPGVISISTDHTATGALAIDLDNDQDYDVVTFNAASQKLEYQLNDGAGVFGAASDLKTSVEDVGDMHAADVDKDGDQDIVYTDPDNDQVYWIENEGAFPFTTETSVLTYNEGFACYCDGGGNPWVDQPVALGVGDLNDDGYVDLVIAHVGSGDDTLRYVLGAGGGSFDEVKQLGGGGNSNPRDIVLADITADGMMDVAVAYESSGDFAYYAQQAGPPEGDLSFGGSTQISAVADGRGIAVGDLDGDDVLDFATADALDEVTWIKYDPNAVLEMDKYTQVIIGDANVTGPLQVQIADMDGDNDLDILVSTEYEIFWYENDGTLDPNTPTFNEVNVYTSGSEEMIYISAPVDLDNDGDLDILASFTSDTDLVWIENDYADCGSDCGSIEKFYEDVDSDGNGYYADFIYTCEAGAGAPTGYSLNDSDDYPTCGSSRDCAGECGGSDETCLDCAGVAYGSSEYSVIGTENTVNTGDADNPQKVQVIDLDGDGDLDVVSTSFDDNTVAWSSSDGAATPGFTFTTVSTSETGAKGLKVIDVDEADGLDIVVTAETLGELAWYKNNGSEVFSRQLVDNTLTAVGFVDAADVDGDGDIDLVTCSETDDEAYWYENDGSESFAQNTLPTTNVDGPVEVAIGDLDDDSNEDIVIATNAGMSGGKIFFYESDGNPDPTFTINEVNVGGGSGLSNPSGLQLFDMESDGDLDIFLADSDANDIFVCKTDTGGMINVQCSSLKVPSGGGPPDDPNAIINPRQLYVTDLDSDGNADLLVPAQGGGKYYWFSYAGNQGGTPVFDENLIISDTNTPGIGGAGDLNGDGITDVVGGSVVDDNLFWYEGDCAEP